MLPKSVGRQYQLSTFAHLPSCSPCLVFPQSKTFDNTHYIIPVMWHLNNFALLLSHVRKVSFLLPMPTVQLVDIQNQEKNVSNSSKSRGECLRKVIENYSCALQMRSCCITDAQGSNCCCKITFVLQSFSHTERWWYPNETCQFPKRKISPTEYPQYIPETHFH